MGLSVPTCQKFGRLVSLDGYCQALPPGPATWKVQRPAETTLNRCPQPKNSPLRQPPLAQRIPHQFHSAAEAQLLHRPRLVRLDALDPHPQDPCNRLVAVPDSCQPQHLDLALAQLRPTARG